MFPNAISGNRIFPEKIWEMPGPGSVPAFGTGCFPVSYRGFLRKFSKFGTVLSGAVSSRLFPGFFLNFLEWRDQKTLVSSRYRQFGKWVPVSSCLVSFKTSSGTDLYLEHRLDLSMGCLSQHGKKADAKTTPSYFLGPTSIGIVCIYLELVSVNTFYNE